jgi:Fe-S-cluster containining protein
LTYNPAMPDGLWYADGLRFACTQCGGCCTGPTGYVWCNDEEIRAMAAGLRITEAQFLTRYTRLLHGRRSLTEVRTRHGYDCVLLQQTGPGMACCSAYDVRPAQCRTWPFWPENLASPEDWHRAARRCPGVAAGISGHGTRYALTRIATLRDSCEPRNGPAAGRPTVDT